jgi:two-component system NtrC family sensor kinase
MKFLSILLITLLCFGLARAQTPKLDSLNRLLKQATTDTGRINLNNEKIIIFNQINIDSAISLGLKTIEQAKRIQFKKGEAKTRIRMSYSYSVKGDFAAAKATLKLAEAIFISTKDSAQLVKVYGSYGTAYGIQSKYDSSIAYQEKSKAIAERLVDKSALISIYSNLGIAYDMQSNRPKPCSTCKNLLPLPKHYIKLLGRPTRWLT